MKVVSGGQTGVDRAALDVAIDLGLAYGGFVPKGGWAEDCPDPPGLLARYPALRETATNDPAARTRLNVRDSDATLILLATDVASPGTALTQATADALGRPLLIVEAEAPDAAGVICEWLDALGDVDILNVAGPRESEAPGLYAPSCDVLTNALRAYLAAKDRRRKP